MNQHRRKLLEGKENPARCITIPPGSSLAGHPFSRASGFLTGFLCDFPVKPGKPLEILFNQFQTLHPNQ
jgi:hypothetical protein